MKSHPAQTRLAAALLAAIITLPATLSAQSSTWDGGGNVGNLWSSAVNWTGDVAPTAGDALVFAGTVNRSTSNDYTAGTSFGGLTLNTAGWTLAGNGIQLLGNITQNHSQASSGANVINLGVELLGATEIFTSNASGSSFRLEMTGALTGAGSITKTGGSTLRLNAAADSNTFAGGVTVSAGTLDLLGTNNLPYGVGKGDISVSSGATLSLNNSNQTINGLNGTGSVIKTGSGSRSLTLGSNDADGNFSGNITMTGGTTTSVTKIGLGTQILGGTVSTLNVNVNAGTLIANGSTTGTTTVGASGTLGGTGTLISATTVNGTLRTNAAPTDFTSRLTFGNTLTLGATADTVFDIDGANFTGVTVSTADSITFGGDLAFNFVNGVTVGSFDLFDFTDATPGSFDNVSVNSFGALSADAGVWSGTYGGFDFSFSEATGDLVVSAIPEPSAFAALAGIVGLSFAASRRRRAA